jgi:regulator of protease activity HflC (stomatin/prohibitin superfamily)
MALFFYTVKEKEEVLIQRFGKYLSTAKEPGLHIKMPWHSIKKVPISLLEMKEDLATKTKDDIFVKLPIKMHLQIEDSKKFVFDSQDPTRQVMSRIAATVKQLTSQMDFAELYQARETISDHVRERVGKEITDLYGMKLVDVIVDEPHAPPEIQSAYNNKKAAEQKKLAALFEGDAKKIGIIAEAEARKEALKLDGEGIAAQRKAIFENYAEQFNQLAQKGLTQEQAHQVITLAMANDTIRDASKHGNTIITTTNANDLLSQMAALGKTLNSPTSIKPANDTGAAPAQKGAKLGNQ